MISMAVMEVTRRRRRPPQSARPHPNARPRSNAGPRRAVACNARPHESPLSKIARRTKATTCIGCTTTRRSQYRRRLRHLRLRLLRLRLLRRLQRPERPSLHPSPRRRKLRPSRLLRPRTRIRTRRQPPRRLPRRRPNLPPPRRRRNRRKWTTALTRPLHRRPRQRSPRPLPWIIACTLEASRRRGKGKLVTSNLSRRVKSAS